MLRSTLLDIIRSFDHSDLNKFDEFLRSPYFNKKESIHKFYTELRKYSPDFNDENLERKLFWNQLFPGKDFNYGRMKNLIHELSKSAERFLTIEAFNRNELQNFIELTSELDNRNIDKVLSTKLLTFEKHFNLNKAKDLNLNIQDYYYLISKLYWMKVFSGNTNSLDSGITLESKLASDKSIFGFLIYLFRSYDNFRVLKFHENRKDDEYSVELILDQIGNNGIESILSFAKSVSELDFKILQCYYSMYRSVSTEGSDEYYFEFKKSLSKIYNLISKNDFRDLCTNLSNSLANLKSVDVNKEKEFFDIYNLMISNNIFTDSNGVLSDNVFNNYIIVQCSLSNDKEIEQFISKYINKLPDNKKDNSYNFAMSHLSFNKSEFRNSLEFISKINFAYFDMKYYVKNLQMMNYYELNEYDAFELAFDSYKQFTNKNKNVHETWKKKSSVFYNTVNQLFRLRNNFDEFEFQKLKKHIKESSPSRRLWLLKKLDELI